MRKQLTIIGCLLLLLAGAVKAADFETATEAVNNMRVGWNLGNTLDSHGSWINGGTDAYETAWGQPVTKPELLRMMRVAGFNAIRVPVTWYQHMDANNQVDAAWMARVREVVDYVINEGMYCILNVHHDTGNHEAAWLVADETVYNQQHERFETLWRQIAEEFRDYDDHLLFEGYNEMLDVKNSWCFASFGANGGYDAAIAQSAYNAINSYAQTFVNTVRATGGNNAERNLVVSTYAACSGSGTWNSHLKDPLKQMQLPNDVTTGHLIFEVHSYLNVENLQNVKNEINDMVSALKTYLAAKGAPVIFGEWGTSNVDGEVTDYDARRENMLAFAKYFVQKSKENGIGTFYWMGLSDGQARTTPVFNQADLALNILQGWYGDSFQPKLPTADDFEYDYTVVRFNQQWSELYLYNGDALSLNEYTGIRLELAETPPTDVLTVKTYGANDNKVSYAGVSAMQTTVNFNKSTLGQSVRAVTLQSSNTDATEVKVVRAVLLKADGTEVETKLSTYWGCQITDVVSLPKVNVHTISYTGQWQEYYLYNGQPLSLTDYKGIRLELAKKADPDLLHVKIYGDDDTVENYPQLSNDLNTTIIFNTNVFSNNVTRISLQSKTETAVDAYIIRAVLIRHDGSEEETTMSVYWGCSETAVTPLSEFDANDPTAIRQAVAPTTPQPYYNLQGQRVLAPRHGLYIRDGKKVLIK